MAARKEGPGVSVTVCPLSAEQLTVIQQLKNRQRGGLNCIGGTLKEIQSVQQEQCRAGAKPKPKVIKKILVKTVNKGKEAKVFTLRNIETDCILSCDDLKKVIRAQLDKDIVDSSFDVGFMQNNTAISIRSDEDLLEVWEQVHSGKSITLWCDGLRSLHGRANKRGTSEIEEPMVEDCEVKSKRKKSDKSDTSVQVEEVLGKLKAIHGTTYTQMQYRVWAEMFVGGIHSSMQEAPSSQMFIRCGTGGAASRRSSTGVVQAIERISTALSPQSAVQSPALSSCSPGRVIENRSRCYKQLGELINLKASGVLSEEEYCLERKAVMASLKGLK